MAQKSLKQVGDIIIIIIIIIITNLLQVHFLGLR